MLLRYREVRGVRQYCYMMYVPIQQSVLAHPMITKEAGRWATHGTIHHVVWNVLSTCTLMSMNVLASHDTVMYLHYRYDVMTLLTLTSSLTR